MESFKSKLTERETAWIKEFFEVSGNASEADRRIYDGTYGSCRVKGFRKVKKFEAILVDIQNRGFDKMEYQGMTGTDFYLGNLEREVEEREKFMKEVGGYKGLFRLIRKMK
jgi:hypothetical protein